MKSRALRVLVVDDDFMIANLHGQYVSRQSGYELAGIAHNYKQTMKKIGDLKPDLILLDMYLPDRPGMEALRSIRAEAIPIDVILITAAREICVVEEAFRLGIFDYLIKPFDLDLLQNALEKYREFKLHLQAPEKADQIYVEHLKSLRSANPSVVRKLPKGLDLRTMERIRQSLVQGAEFQKVEAIAAAAGVSRSTARGYLDYMVGQGIAEEVLQYGTVGRPHRLFRLVKPQAPDR